MQQPTAFSFNFAGGTKSHVISPPEGLTRAFHLSHETLFKYLEGLLVLSSSISNPACFHPTGSAVALRSDALSPSSPLQLYDTPVGWTPTAASPFAHRRQKRFHWKQSNKHQLSPKPTKPRGSRDTFVSNSRSARRQQNAAVGGCQQALSPSPQCRRWRGSNGSFNYMTEFLINSVNCWRHFSSNSRKGWQLPLRAVPRAVQQQSILLPCPYPRHWEEINVWKSAFIWQKRAEKATVPAGCLHPALIFHVSGVLWKWTPLDHINGKKYWGKEVRKVPLWLWTVQLGKENNCFKDKVLTERTGRS